MDLLYPVGICIEFAKDVDPNILWSHTTWIQDAKGKVSIGVDDSDDDFKYVGKTGGSKTNIHHHFTLNSFDGAAFYATASGEAPTSRVVNKKRIFMGGSYGVGTTREDTTYNETISIMQPYITRYKWTRVA